MKKTVLMCGALASLCAAGGQALAGQGVPLGPATRFESAVQAYYLITDNYYRTNSGEVDATGFLLAPRLGLFYTPSDGEFSFSYQGKLAEIDTSSEDDYMDHTLSANANMRPAARHAFDFSAAYLKGHDDIGTVRTSGQVRVDNRELDKWEGRTANLKYTFGATSARLNWYLRGLYFDREYTTNESGPLGTRFLSRQTTGLGTGVTYKMTSKTKLLLDIEESEIDYDNDLNPSLDGTLTRIFAGIRWLATAKTNGEFWAGHFSRDFDDPGREDGSGASWKANFTWSPRIYSNITFDTGQSVEEAILFGENFINRKYYGVRWDHDWSVRFKTFVRYRLSMDDYEGSQREDDIHNYGLGASYELSKYYSVGIDISALERESSNKLFDYSRDSILLTFNAVY